MIQIHNHRVSLNWSQEDLATRMDVSTKTVDRWERGYSGITHDQIAKLATFFGVSFEAFIDLKPKNWEEIPDEVKYGKVFGVLELTVNQIVFRFPVDEVNRLRVHNALFINDFVNQKSDWIWVTTLNDRLVFMQSAKLDAVRLQKVESNDPSMPTYYSPDIYDELTNELNGKSENEEVRNIAAEIGPEELDRMFIRVECVDQYGHVKDMPMESDAMEETVQALDKSEGSVLSKNAFGLLERNYWYDALAINLSKIAIINLPSGS
ncbi:helix-turn-helix domain-containing protein [Pseudomonadota bacterium]